jgi:hypothetical protein
VTITKTYQIYPWLTVELAVGSVSPGSSQTIQVICDGTVMPLGDYEGTIFVSSNDPDFPMIEIPVFFHVDYASGNESGVLSQRDVIVSPNPFSENVSIRFSLAQPSDVSLEIFDLSGELVLLLPEDFLNAGTYSFGWNGKNKSGDPVKSGIYIYRLKTDDGQIIGKIIRTE